MKIPDVEGLGVTDPFRQIRASPEDDSDHGDESAAQDLDITLRSSQILGDSLEVID